MAVATKIQLPYLEDTKLDGKKIHTPREWTERFRHYMKRVHNIDIKQILTNNTVHSDENWNTKKPGIRQAFTWAPDHQQLKLSQKESLIQILTQSKLEN